MTEINFSISQKWNIFLSHPDTAHLKSEMSNEQLKLSRKAVCLGNCSFHLDKLMCWQGGDVLISHYDGVVYRRPTGPFHGQPISPCEELPRLHVGKCCGGSVVLSMGTQCQLWTRRNLDEKGHRYQWTLLNCDLNFPKSL